YFSKQPAEKQVSKDHSFMGKLLQRFGETDLAAASLEKAVEMDTSNIEKNNYIKELAALYKKTGNRSKEAHWLGEGYKLNIDTATTDLHNWGMAHYFAKEYAIADTVFGIYIEKYPDQVYGYYWK